jgi:LysM repeat protein
MSSEACCTCATLLSSIPPTYDEKTEKPTVHERRLECCSRAICARCTTDNPRFATYCPFCQVSTDPSPLPQGLRDPPAYSPPADTHGISWAPPSLDDRPPPYSEGGAVQPVAEKPGSSGQDVLHFIDPVNDSINTLSIRYGVPAAALRRTNGLYSDHLLAARRTILIPGEYYKGGVSLSPRPLEGEEEEARKSKVRKWMVACKVAEYVFFFDIDVLRLRSFWLTSRVLPHRVGMTLPFYISSKQNTILMKQLKHTKQTKGGKKSIL